MAPRPYAPGKAAAPTRGSEIMRSSLRSWGQVCACLSTTVVIMLKGWDHDSEPTDGERNHDPNERSRCSGPGPGRLRGPGWSGLLDRYGAPSDSPFRARRAPVTGHGLSAWPTESG